MIKYFHLHKHKKVGRTEYARDYYYKNKIRKKNYYTNYYQSNKEVLKNNTRRPRLPQEFTLEKKKIVINLS